MDKYEYQVCTEQIKTLISQKKFVEAMDVADTIDWRRVRSVSMLCTVSEIYKINKRYEDARDILLLAYERHPTGRDIIYALCELAIKTNDIVQAIECYKEFIALAPNDSDSYVLLYKIYKAQDVSLEEQIDVLEDLKSKDYREKWGYELAYLYHLTGQETKCIAACDELVLWFGEGKYVKKALELKMQHTTLSAEQQAKYEGRSTGSIPAFNQPVETSQFGNNPQMTGPMMSQYGEYIQQTGQITGQLPDTYYTGEMPAQSFVQNNQMGAPVNGPVMDQYGNLVQTDGYGNLVQITPNQYNSLGQPIQAAPMMNHLGMTQDIIITPSDDGAFSTMDLQEQLGNQVKEVLAMDINGTQPIVFDNNQEMFNNAQRDYTSPELFEDKFSIEEEVSESDENKLDSPVKLDAMVHTGVIDLSGAELPPVESSSIEVEEQVPEKEEVIVSVEKRSIDDTSDIMSKLEGVIPGSAPLSKESLEVERIPGTTAAAGTDTIKGISAIQGLSAIQNLPKDDESKETGANGSVVNVPKTKSSVTGSIPAFLPSEKDAADNEDKDDDDVKIYTGSDSDDITDAQENVSPNDSDISEESDASEIHEEKKTSQYPYDTVVDIGYVEELPEIEEPSTEPSYEADEINEEVEQSEEDVQKAYETDTLPEEDDEFDDEENSGNIYSRMRKDIRSRREFDDEEFRIFCRYDGIEALKAQLVDALDAMSMEGHRGNVVVMGSENTDRKEIAISIVKVLKEKSPVFSGKVAKISGEALNKKNIKTTLSKLDNGALIVEAAGGLLSETMVLIASTLADEQLSVLVVLEDTKENLKHLYKSTKLMRSVFDARVEIYDFTNNDLVAYGRGYALEKEYTIDEFGTLALSSKLGELQTYDHKVTVDEVKEIIDTAIKHAGKKNVSNFMDVLLGKRYDDEDFVILKEKDFNF